MRPWNQPTTFPSAAAAAQAFIIPLPQMGPRFTLPPSREAFMPKALSVWWQHRCHRMNGFETFIKALTSSAIRPGADDGQRSVSEIKSAGCSVGRSRTRQSCAGEKAILVDNPRGEYNEVTRSAWQIIADKIIVADQGSTDGSRELLPNSTQYKHWPIIIHISSSGGLFALEAAYLALLERTSSHLTLPT
jgi:hypothetical protein